MFLSACTDNIPLTSVEVERLDAGDLTISANVPSDVAKNIRDNGWYFAMVIKNCGEDDGQRYPMEPFVGNSSADTFRYSVVGPYVSYHGTISSKVFSEFQKPCLKIEGNNYYIYTLTSSEYPITVS